MLTDKQIVSAVLRGAVRAARIYMNMTGGYTVLDDGVESMISSTIAASIFEKMKSNKTNVGFVDLELRFSALKKSLFVSSMRSIPQKEFRGRPRVDIAVYNPAGWAIAIIEVKRRIDYPTSLNDIKRIRAILREVGKERGSIRFGCVVGLRVRRKSKGQRKSIGDDFMEQFTNKLERKFPDLSCTGRIKSFKVPRQLTRDTDLKNTTGYDAICFQIRLRNQAPS